MHFWGGIEYLFYRRGGRGRVGGGGDLSCFGVGFGRGGVSSKNKMLTLFCENKENGKDTIEILF